MINDLFLVSSLLWAAGRGYYEIVQLLIDNNVKVDIGDKYGTTALIWACRRGHLETVELLLRAGASVDAVGMYSWTPLLVICLYRVKFNLSLFPIMLL
jgi:ankyrin repeat protein